MNIEDLADVNEEVNQLPYRSDASRYFTPEFWAAIDSSGGDCEDFAIGKLNRLVGKGWPIDHLRLACCYVETGEYHAILIVDTDQGPYVLDNRYPTPMTISELTVLGYICDKIQAVGGSRNWVKWFN